MRRDEKGFSLVELIVVIAIMAVVSTIGVLSFAMVTGRQVSSCAEDMETYLKETRVQALSRSNAELEIYTTDDGVFVNLALNGTGTAEKVGRSGITVSYKKSDGTEVTLSNTERLVLSFDRSTGAFLPLSGDIYCKEIMMESGNHSRKIVLVPKTGKFYIEE